jgi:uncharacterized membrane protein YdjX (TVP38/TMEM64 family)
MGRLKDLSTVAVIAVPVLLYLCFSHLLSIQSLNENRQLLNHWAQTHSEPASAFFIVVMVVVIALTVPGATILSFAGGIMFPQPRAAAFAYLGYVLGACGSFLVVRTILYDLASVWLRKVRGYSKLESMLRENAFVYLVFARFTLLFPFWFVNGTAAVVGIPFKTFISATALSSIPGAIIYTTAGGALGKILDSIDSHGVRDLSVSNVIYQTITTSEELKVCLALMAVTATVPLIIRKIHRRSRSTKGD